MAFGFAGAAAGASDTLQELLARAFAQKQAEQQMALQQQQAERQAAAQQLQEREFTANQQYRTGQVERQATQDRQVGNQQGVRRMIGDFLMQRGSQPLDVGARTQIAGMAVGEGVDVPDALLTDPNQQHTSRMAEIAEQGRQSRLTAQARPDTPAAQDWVIRGGQATPISRGTAQPGDQPYDAVAQRQQNGNPDQQAEARDTAMEVQRIAAALRDHPGFAGTFGIVSGSPFMPTFRQSTKDAETLMNSLRGLLTLENMGKMKGVLSDSDMRIIRQASTTLDAQMSEPAARAELDRLVQVMSKVTSGPGASAPTGTSPAPQAPASGVQKWGRDAQGRPVRIQ